MHSGWIRRRVLYVVLAAFVLCTGRAGAQQSASITLTPSSGPAGAPFTVTGGGYPSQLRGPACTIEIRWASPGGELLGTVDKPPGESSFQVIVEVPSSAQAGPAPYEVWALGCGEQPSARFTVTPAPTTTTTTKPEITTVDETTTTTTTTTKPEITTVDETTTTTTTTTTPETTTVDETTTTTTSTVPASTGVDGSMVLDRLAAPPGGVVVATGRGCDAGAAVELTVAGGQVGRARADVGGRFEAKLALPDLTPGRYDVTARCGPELRVPIDLVLASSSQGATSSLAVLVFFLLVGLGMWLFRRAATPVDV